MTFQHLKLPLFLLTVGAVTGYGQHVWANEGAKEGAAEDMPLQAQAVQLCRSGGYPAAFVQIATDGAPLRVRVAPEGRQIGLIPDGWEVRVLEWSRNGSWVKVTGQYGGGGSFMSAPNFSEGWVSAGYVKNLTRACQKPSNAAQLLRPDAFGARPIEVQGDWLAMGDALAEQTAV